MIRRARPGDEDLVYAAGGLFDGDIDDAALDRFLRSSTHHLLLALDDGAVVGFVSGVETTHPDKGTEMLLYELSVGERWRRRGHGGALVRALAELGRDRGCHGMWVLTDRDNPAAMATYRATGSSAGTDHVMLDWTFGSRD